MRKSGLAMVLTLGAALWPVAATSADPTSCDAVGAIRSYCGVPGPEDIEVLPGGGAVIASDMQIATARAKSLKWVDLKSGAVTALYPSPNTPAGKPEWGDPACTEEIGSALQPHGTSLARRRDGRWELLVVNHGNRESVELFELGGRKGKWTLAWRGCVVPPAPNRLNDVAALPDGGFVVTTMHRLGDRGTEEAIRLSQAGQNTGFLWRWLPGKGLIKQAGSDTPRPNGVQADKAGRYAYIFTADRGGGISKLDLRKGTIVAAMPLSKPDNGSWAAYGRLISVSMTPDAMAPCLAKPAAPCLAAFEVHAIDTRWMTSTRIFAQSGAPFGGATVAIQAGRDLLIGSMFGDRFIAVTNLFGAKKPGK